MKRLGMRETVSAAATNPSIYVGDLARKIKPCANRPVTTEAVNPTTIPISKASGINGPITIRSLSLPYVHYLRHASIAWKNIRPFQWINGVGLLNPCLGSNTLDPDRRARWSTSGVSIPERSIQITNGMRSCWGYLNLIIEEERAEYLIIPPRLNLLT